MTAIGSQAHCIHHVTHYTVFSPCYPSEIGRFCCLNNVFVTIDSSLHGETLVDDAVHTAV